MRWLGLLVLLVASFAAHGETWRFAMIGDTPYSSYERDQLPAMLQAVVDNGVELVIHVGDIKNGQSRCDDALFADRRQLFDSVAVPFVLVAGDNEWTDCARASNGNYDPVERLSRLRSIFWPEDHSLGRRTIALQRQAPGYPEHARFRLGPVWFVTLNVPGPDNHFGMGAQPRREYLARNPALLAWLRETFALARHDRAAGVVVAMQANPGFQDFDRGLAHAGFRELLTTLRDESMAFAGQVLLLHGDTHHHQIDQPLVTIKGEKVRNFTRVESYGSPFMGWVKVVIDDQVPGLFRIESNPWPGR